VEIIAQFLLKAVVAFIKMDYSETRSKKKIIKIRTNHRDKIKQIKPVRRKGKAIQM
jgi:hypothetical protein